MASITNSLTDGVFLREVDLALRARIAEGLKKPLMEMAEQMVDAQVEIAVAALEPDIKAYINEARQSLDLRIVVERANKKAKEATK